MDIQAYFEEWSCGPGDPARSAISTALPSVHASFVRLISAPVSDGHPEALTEDHAGILDRTVAGRLQTTAVGSLWPTTPTRDAKQTIWSGSITYGGALAWNGCDDGRARRTANNVLRAFAADTPLHSQAR